MERSVAWQGEGLVGGEHIDACGGGCLLHELCIPIDVGGVGCVVVQLHGDEVDASLEELRWQGEGTFVGVAWRIGGCIVGIVDFAIPHEIASCFLAVDIDHKSVVGNEVEDEGLVLGWHVAEWELTLEVVGWSLVVGVVSVVEEGLIASAVVAVGGEVAQRCVSCLPTWVEARLPVGAVEGPRAVVAPLSATLEDIGGGDDGGAFACLPSHELIACWR